MHRFLAGKLAVHFLALAGLLPIRLTFALGALLLPLYVPFRRATRARLRRLDPPVSPLAYYRMRLRLALLSLRHTLGRPDGCTVIVEGAELLEVALASGKPVALLGWHQGPVELLHRIPADAATRAGRKVLVMTAGAFSPALSAWMARGRASSGTTVVRPDETAMLRDWIRDAGVLAAMVDQVPGAPEHWLRLRGGTVSLPWPGRLMEWIAAREPECLVVAVRWEPGDRIVFRYERIGAATLREDSGRLMEEAIRQAPEQYNWSYPKVSVQ
jgi:lauroyl/myristoyl acyltransferase